MFAFSYCASAQEKKMIPIEEVRGVWSRKFIYDNFGLFGVYAIKQDHEYLQIFADVISSPHLNKEEMKF